MKNSILIIIALLSIVSCENKLEINAPYRQIAVVYSFIDKNEPYQYLRIQKVFQNSVDVKASEAAQVSDSLYLNDLKVQLLVKRSSNIVDTLNCERINTIPKESGFFASDKNFLYKSAYYVMPTDVMSVNLWIKDTVTGAEFTSQTTLIGDQKIEPRNIAFSENAKSYIRFVYALDKSAKGPSVVDEAIRLNYIEAPLSNPNAFEYKYYDYYVRSGVATAKLGVNVSNNVYTKVLLDNFRNHFNKLPSNVIRKYVNFEYITWGAGPEFLEIQEISKPNISFAQKKTDYSNIKNGLGMFSGRTVNKQSQILLTDSATTDSSRYFISQFKGFVR
jgi:hypothetical protein